MKDEASMTNKERIEALEREVAEFKAKERQTFYPYWSVLPQVHYGQCPACGGPLVQGHACPWRHATTISPTWPAVGQ